MPPRKASGSRRGGNSNSSASRAALPIPDSYPGLVDGKGMGEEQWQACKEMLEVVYKAKDGNRKVADIFRELPDKDEYEDYYQAIPEPECLDNISTQLGAQTYPRPEAFFKQLHLVFLNAKHYNEDESLLWADAQRLETQIHADWKTRAEAGIFPNIDPYHSSPVKPGRKKRGPSAVPSKSSTPLPEPKVAPPVSLPKSVPAAAPAPTPIPVAAPVSSPVAPPLPPIPEAEPAREHPFIPAAIPAPTPPIIRSTPSSSTAISQPLIPPPSPTSSEKARQSQAEMDRRVVAALDARLPRWPGPQQRLPGPPSSGGIMGSGWFGEGAPDYEQSMGGPAMWPHRIRAVAQAIASYRDKTGDRFAVALEALPDVADIPYLSFTSKISLYAIRAAAAADPSRYTTLPEFDIEMTRLFEKARRYYHDGSAEYGKVLVLQRLYNALTAVYPMPLPASGIPAHSSTLFASLPAGPGNARSLHETAQELRAGAAEEEVGFGITTFRVGTKDRQFTDEARHKGQSYRVGDYVHLINPDDATRPIIGQIFKTFVPTKGYRTHHVTVCWYYRPEQTVHTQDRRFFEREVFKTGHFCDHPVEDILEKISVQFYVKYIRGRPRAGEYYPGWPIYVCHSRFNDREYLSVRIKNWNSCIPDELRQTEFMSIVPFERNIEVPMVESPFLRGVQGPGFFGEPRKGPGGEDDDDDDDEQSNAREREKERERDKPRRKERVKRESQIQPPTPTPTHIQTQSHVPIQGPPPPMATKSHYSPAPPPVPSPVPVPATHTPLRPGATPTPASTQLSHRPPLPQSHSSSSAATLGNAFPSRTFTAIMGGQQVMEQSATKELLPRETVQLFDRDARGNVLWFSGPPIPYGTIPIPAQQVHSIEYLAYLSKRKQGEVDVAPVKRLRPSGTRGIEDEHLIGDGLEIGASDLWWAEGQSQDQVEAGLKELIESIV